MHKCTLSHPMAVYGANEIRTFLVDDNIFKYYNSLATISRRAIPPKYFENIFKTNDSVGVTRQQTWLRNEEIAEYFGENLDILTDLNMDFQ